MVNKGGRHIVECLNGLVARNFSLLPGVILPSPQTLSCSGGYLPHLCLGRSPRPSCSNALRHQVASPRPRSSDPGRQGQVPAHGLLPSPPPETAGQTRSRRDRHDEIFRNLRGGKILLLQSQRAINMRKWCHVQFESHEYSMLTWR